MKKTSVTLHPANVAQSHPVFVGTNLVPILKKVIEEGSFSKIVILHDQVLKKAADSWKKKLSSSKQPVECLGLKVSETIKSWKSAGEIHEKLFKMGLDRSSLLIAIGGGTLGDLGGFLAGTYMRGIPWVSVPTTLLAMVDSGIGGKTAVNLKDGKNICGVFHQPLMTLSDLSFLSTLPKREWVSGWGEIVKYGIAYDSGFFRKLVLDFEKLSRGDEEAWEKVVFHCSEIKAKIVSQDIEDRLGIREILNFGHTAAHAIETITDYKKYRHGEAVILGMRIESRISYLMGECDRSTLESVEEFLKVFPIPVLPLHITPAQMFLSFKSDKKAKQGVVNLVALREIGKVRTVTGIGVHHVREAMVNL